MTRYSTQTVAPIKYSQVAGPRVILTFPLSASEVFTDTGGKFMSTDANRRAEVAAAADTDLIGWGLTGAHTSSSTAGADLISVNISLDAVYLMPLDAARTEAQLLAIMLKTCDIVTTSNIQYADYDASSTDVIQIVGYRYWGSASGEQAVLVRLNPNKLAATGVA